MKDQIVTYPDRYKKIPHPFCVIRIDDHYCVAELDHDMNLISERSLIHWDKFCVRRWALKLAECYTDYPLFEDDYNKKAPIRRVVFKSYDGDKYCDVEYEGRLYSIKSGYLYSQPKRIDESPEKFRYGRLV